MSDKVEKKGANDFLEKIKTKWKEMPAKTKKIIGIGAGAVLAVGLMLAIVFGSSSSNDAYRAIFPGMTTEESIQVYSAIQEMGVVATMDNKGQVLVPTEQWDNLVFQLNSQGYPKTTLSYDTFTSASGFTSTEFEKKTALIFQAQDRMQQTLLRQEGIADATVTFTVAETSNLVWNQSNQQESSGNVSVRMKNGYELTPERVSAIKHLAATSVPNLKAENVVVVDAATGIQMSGVDDAAGKGYYNVQRLEFEQQICKSIEDNVKRLLSGKYGPDGVTAVATVTIDYDKMVSESKQYQPSESGGNSGVINHYEENYSLNGNVGLGGIVGEENNTDVPSYVDSATGEEAAATDYNKVVDYDVGYVLTQIEKGEPILQKASIAVIVNDPEFTLETEETLVDLVAKATNISSNNIRVTNLNFKDNTAEVPDNIPTDVPDQTGFALTQRQIIILAIIGLLLLIIFIVVLVLVLKKRKKTRLEREHEREMAQLEEEERQRQLNLEKEIEEKKRAIQNEAMAKSKTKESAITDEVRGFAAENPEITASLIRSLLKEDQ